MTSPGHVSELDLLRKHVADLSRQLAEQDRLLQEQTRHLRIAQAMAHAGSWEWEVESGRMVWSEEVFEMFGQQPGATAMTYDAFLAALLPDDHDRVLAATNAALAGSAPYDIECRIVRPDGEVRTIHCRGQIRRNQDGRPSVMSGIIVDITDRMRTESVLKRGEAYFRALIEHSSDIITVLGLDGTIQFESPSFEHLLGYNQKELDGRIAFEFVHPDDLPAVLEKFQLVIQQPEEPQVAEFRFRHKDGSWLSLEGIGRSILDQDGRRCVIVNSRDITERKKAEQALLERDALTRSFLDNSATVAWMKNAEGRYVYISPSLERRFHTRSENWIGKTDFELWPPEIAETLRKNDLVVLRENRVIETVEEVENSDGSRSWWLSHKFPFQDAAGQRYAGGLGVDITERKQIEAALRESEARYLSLIEAIPQQVWTARPDGTLDYVNRRVLDYFSCQPDDLLGWEWQSVLHPEDLPACLASWSNALRTGEPYEIEFRLRRAFDGAYRWHLARALPIKDASNRILKWFGTNTDITERKQAEEALRISEERYARATAIGKVGVWELDVAKGTYHGDANLKALFGYDGDELSTDPYVWLNLVHPEDRSIALDHWQQIVSGAMDHYNYAIRMIRKDGTIIWTDVRGRAVRDATGRLTHLFGATVDSTDRKRVEESLRQREQELQTVLRERERISEDLHDGILQSLYAVGLGLESCKPLMRQRKYEQATVLLVHAIGQLNHVMTEVRNFIAGLESQVLQGGDFAVALQTMVQTLSVSAATACRVSIEEAAARQLSTEQALHLMNVVREALSNSLRHSRAKRISVSLKPLAGVIRLSVADNGVGFRPDAAQGVGHGLANMVARARKIGGRFVVHSKPRKGTKILLDLPKVMMSARH